MDFSAPALALGKLLVIFASILILLRFKLKLWQTILAGSLTTALLTGIEPARWPGVVFDSLLNKDFIILVCMIFLILMLSAVQEATGQSNKMVKGIERHLRIPRLRLVLFPALVGLLPMPGGALFSCPMIKAAAEGMELSNQKKSLINYWFRHIWETAWPLYPGYILICTLLDIPLTELWRYTFPLVLVAFGAGWLGFMRELAGSKTMAEHECALTAEKKDGETLGQVLLHGLPIAVVLAGALVFSFLFGLFFPQLPGQLAFCASLALAVAVALYQGRSECKIPISKIAFSPNVGRIFLLLGAIYIFKDTVAAGGLVQSLGLIAKSDVLLVLVFFVAPFIGGLLTGLMVGFVGLSFPILLGIIEHSPMQEHLLPLIVLAMVGGNCGQMLSPVHVCLVVTCEFFTTTLTRLLQALTIPVLVIGALGSVWAFILAIFGAHF